MNFKVIRVFALAMIASVMSGCMRVGDFSMMCPKNIDFEHNEYEIDKTRRLKGSDWSILMILPYGLPDFETAVKNACEGVPNCVGLANVGVRQNSLGLLFFEYEATGNPIIKKGGK